MSDLNEVMREAQAEVKRLGDDYKSANDRLQRDLAAMRSDINSKAARGDLDTIIKDKLDALGVEIKNRAEGDVSGIQSRIDQIEMAIKRNGGVLGGAADTPEQKERKTTFYNYIRFGNDEAKLKELHAAESKSMLSGSDPNGGYFVEPAVSQRVIEKVQEICPIRQIAQVETITSNELELPVDTDMAEAEWVDETSEREQTRTPRLGKKRIVVHELHAQPAATQALLEDAAIDIGSWLSKKLGQSFALKEGRAFTLGTGQGQPRGFLTYAPGASGTAGETLPVVMSGAPTGFPDGNGTADALFGMVYALKAAYRANASWLMPRSLQYAVRTMKDDRGNYLWQPGLIQGQPDRLLGYPVYDAEDMPEMAAGSLSIAFGDWRSGYTIVDRLGIQTLRDPFSRKPWVLFDTRKRVGGDVVNFEALVLMRTGTK